MSNDDSVRTDPQPPLSIVSTFDQSAYPRQLQHKGGLIDAVITNVAAGVRLILTDDGADGLHSRGGMLANKALPLGNNERPVGQPPQLVRGSDHLSVDEVMHITAPMGRGKATLPSDWRERLNEQLAATGGILIDPLGDDPQHGYNGQRDSEIE